MSSWPGFKLEDFLSDLYFLWEGVNVWKEGMDAKDHVRDPDLWKEFVDIHEPIRGPIERALEDYEEEEHGSWRDQRYALADLYITDEMEKKAQEIAKKIRDKCPACVAENLVIDKVRKTLTRGEEGV